METLKSVGGGDAGEVRSVRYGSLGFGGRFAVGVDGVLQCVPQELL